MRVAEQTSGLCAVIHDNNPASLKQGPWDIAANQIIFEEAGGSFVNPNLERTSAFKAEPIIIAPTLGLAKQIVDCIDAHANPTLSPAAALSGGTLDRVSGLKAQPSA